MAIKAHARERFESEEKGPIQTPIGFLGRLSTRILLQINALNVTKKTYN
jgi:hypothetical protein